MHDNITKVAERGERLDALQDKTGELHHSRKRVLMDRHSCCVCSRFQERSEPSQEADVVSLITAADTLTLQVEGPPHEDSDRCRSRHPLYRHHRSYRPCVSLGALCKSRS